MSPPAGLLPETLQYIERSKPSLRKRLGQYFTPEPLRRALVSRLQLQQGMRVLDPGVGTGEFLLTCSQFCPGLELYGWDIDPSALAVAPLVIPNAQFELRDTLRFYRGPLFDVVVGNPPYYEVRGRPDLRKRFSDVIAGRPNIFAMFFKSCLALLRDGGKLAFVVPPSMNNGAYFEKLRIHIGACAEIEYLEIVKDSELFLGAQQSVQFIILKKGGTQKNYQFETPTPHYKRTFFCENPPLLAEMYKNRTSLYDLGYRATTGGVVWNQVKDKLLNHPAPGAVPLLWSQNVENGKVCLYNVPKRPQFVYTNRIMRGPAIIANRVTGSVKEGAIRPGLVEKGFIFAAENHVNVIVPREDAGQKISFEELLHRLRSVELQQRVRALTGNTQISAKELTYLVPVDVN